MKSMTGFGKGAIHMDGFEYSVEIKSVNSRYKDIKCSGPKEMIHFEHKIEKLLQKAFARGKFSVVFQKNSVAKSKQESFQEKAIIENWKALDKVRKKIGLEQPVNLETLVQVNRGLFVQKAIQKSSVQDDEKRFLKAANLSVSDLKTSRQREGTGIEKVMLKLQSAVKKHVKQVEKQFKIFHKSLSKKIKTKIAELPEEYVQDSKKFENDLIAMKDKSDITEELDRLSIHLERLRTLLKSKGVVGREMDFLMQEINREINTIGSKSSEVSISNQVVLLKTDMEKLREQAQNLE